MRTMDGEGKSKELYLIYIEAMISESESLIKALKEISENSGNVIPFSELEKLDSEVF